VLALIAMQRQGHSTNASSECFVADEVISRECLAKARLVFSLGITLVVLSEFQKRIDVSANL
jgi:hypothetical protein